MIGVSVVRLRTGEAVDGVVQSTAAFRTRLGLEREGRQLLAVADAEAVAIGRGRGYGSLAVLYVHLPDPNAGPSVGRRASGVCICLALNGQTRFNALAVRCCRG